MKQFIFNAILPAMTQRVLTQEPLNKKSYQIVTKEDILAAEIRFNKPSSLTAERKQIGFISCS